MEQDAPASEPANRPQLFALCWLPVLLVVPSWVIVGLLIGSAAAAVVWVGLALWLVTVGGLRRVADAFRWVAGRILGEHLITRYRHPPRDGIFARLQATLTDPARWRDVAYVFFAVSLGFAMTLSSAIAFLFFPLGYWLSPLLLRSWAGATKTIIGPTGEQALTERIDHLEQSRSASVDHSAAELRRIERDLHDGAQAQLVALGMSLGMAEELVIRDPPAASKLIADAQATSHTALADLRSLVRGIHPPVLADRGLAGAVEALTLSSPAPVQLRIGEIGRLPAPIESALYFAVAEALTNAAKHADAQATSVAIDASGGSVTAQVRDDGVGGARILPGGGLAGIERRMAAFDGSVTVSSPDGGPTTITMTIPHATTPPDEGAAG